MATPIRMRRVDVPVEKVAYKGFSWTTFFWGPFPPMFRGDGIGVLIGMGLVVVSLFIPLLPFLVWAFFYNDNHFNRLLETGWVPVDQAALGVAAGVVLPGPGTYPSPYSQSAGLWPLPAGSQLSAPAAPAGWYPDPDRGPGSTRYWDGTAWTQYRS
ncbi:MAG: DUF2510 domain-containing protein [Candidatus Nanopelagicales bacterium]